MKGLSPSPMMTQKNKLANLNNLLMLLPVHGSPAELRGLQTVVEIPLAFGIGKEEDLH